MGKTSSQRLKAGDKRKINGKQKGSAFERKWCNNLSLWASEGSNLDYYWRSAMSGGRATLNSRKGLGQAVLAQSGDISCIHPDGNFLLYLFQIECKHYKELKWDSLVYGHPGLLDKIFHPTRKQAEAFGRAPMIIAKANNRDTMLITTPQGFKWLQWSASREIVPRTTYPAHNAVLLDARTFVTVCKPDLMRAIPAPKPPGDRDKSKYQQAMLELWPKAAERRRVADIEPPAKSRGRRRVCDKLRVRVRAADV